MRAIIINAEQRAVSESEIDGKLDSLQGIVGGLITPVYDGLDSKHHAYINDEGLLNNPQHFFMLRDGHQPLAGNGVILGTTGDGDEAACTLPLDWVKERVAFMDLQAVREWVTRGERPDIGSFLGEVEAGKQPTGPAEPPALEVKFRSNSETQTPATVDPWIQAASANLDISAADRLQASNLFHEFQRLDWWSDYSDDGDVRQREAARTHNAFAQLREFAGASNDHAYLASRIYDKTAPEEFAKPARWYVAEHDARQEIEGSRWSDGGGSQKTGQGQKP
jgi:Domain of unknown function (DUF3846)